MTTNQKTYGIWNSLIVIYNNQSNGDTGKITQEINNNRFSFLYYMCIANQEEKLGETAKINSKNLQSQENVCC